ncbi:MAG: AAA domain-containing protein [bacterium]|nr:AAA domain-containing protein [bacterium]
MSSRDVKDFADAVLSRVERKMFGMGEVTRMVLTALYTGGHVLLEGNPGLGKTELVKTLGEVLALPRGRIQFTPDLMPADITGTYAPDFEEGGPQKMTFQRGPVFTSLLLADEINRAPPKTQSAMLEAMAERQVTVLGKKWPLEMPFMVLATQNPIDHEGTFNLPEAQADRFMFKLSVPVPDRDTLRLIVDKTAGDRQEPEEKSYAVFKDAGASRETYLRLERRIKKLPVSPPVEIHILNMFLASNRRFEELKELDKKQVEKLKRLVDEVLEYGLGPRAATAMMLGAKAFSLMFLAGAESAEGPALARVVIPVLRHRFKLKFDWLHAFGRIEGLKETGDEDGYGYADNEEMVMQLIRSFCLAAAPRGKTYGEYYRNFEGSFLRGGKV